MKMKAQIAGCLIVFFLVWSPSVQAKDDVTQVVTGIIQSIDGDAITVEGITYYPVDENFSLENFSVGEQVKILYEANQAGYRYYHAIVKEGEKLPAREGESPA